MRMLIGAIGLTSTALFLQGCGGGGGGGGGGGPTTTCHAPHLEFVAQSIEGTVSGSMSGTMNQTMPSSSFSEKIDFEHFNLYSTSSSSVPVTDPTTGETITVETHTVQIINVAEKHAIMYVEASMPGNTTKQCMLIPLPDELPDVAALSAMLRTEVAAAECGGNDGTYDTWRMSKSYDGPIPAGILPPDLPVDLPPGLTVGGSVNVEITTSNDLLLHSAHVAMNVSVMAGESALYSEDISEDVVISSAEAGGPSPADLDPAQFDVECTTPDGVNVDTLVSSGTPGVFQKHAVTTLQAALRLQNVAIV